jgi:hypothetical protein
MNGRKTPWGARRLAGAVVLAGLALLVAAASWAGPWAALAVAGIGLVPFGLFMIDVPEEKS